MTERFKALADHWRDVGGLDDEMLAAQIERDRIDLLVDLQGLTGRTFLGVLARRPAPVQVTWIAYAATIGLPTIDWRFADAVADPTGTDAFYSERLWRLPDCFLCYGPMSDVPEIAPLPARRNGFVTFGSFNFSQKLGETTVALWAQVLQAVPDARLLLKSRRLDHADTLAALKARFAAHGVAPERIATLPFAPTPFAHLACYASVDVALDPTPYNGTTTTCQALLMGVPVVTLCGDRHVARVGASLLTAAGLPEFVAATPDDYVATAAGLALDLDRLADMRAGLRDRLRASPLMGAATFTQAVEAAYRAMWQEWCERPQPVAMPPAAAATLNEPEGLEIVIAGDIRVLVPADIRRLTPSILLEQEDWFEDEVGFVRRLLEPGEAAIDIGANYGLYTLPMAKAVGPSGRVLAIEPASRTMAWLQRSLVANGFDQVVTAQVALSDRIGEATLALRENPELNSIRTGPQPDSLSAGGGGAGEIVRLARLEDVAKALEGYDVAFLKLDAEGEEARIVTGAEDFLRRRSPLIMIEINHEGRFDIGPLVSLAALGYAAYRLIPGLGLLAPFDPRDPVDRFHLNRFCCKPDRAAVLAARGLLVESGRLAELMVPVEPGGPLQAALADAKAATEPERPAAERLLRLCRAKHSLVEAQIATPSICELATIARLARDLGERELAITTLTRLLALLGGPPEPLGELLLPEPCFDAGAPGENPWDWLCIAASEAWIQAHRIVIDLRCARA